MIRRSIFALTVLALAVSWPALAGDDKIELTPFIGYRGGGEFENYYTGDEYSLSSAESYGATFDYPTSDETKVEVLFSRQPTELRTSGAFGTDAISLEMAYYHNSSSAIFCGGGGCTFGFGGNAIWQGEATAGLIIAF